MLNYFLTIRRAEKNRAGQLGPVPTPWKPLFFILFLLHFWDLIKIKVLFESENENNEVNQMFMKALNRVRWAKNLFWKF